MLKCNVCFQLSLGLTGTLEKWQCSCKAGNGFCQHAVATLYQAAHYVKTKCRTVPSQLSRTSSPQSWGIPRRTAGFCTRPIHDITVKSVKRQLISPSTSTNSTNGVSPFPAKRRKVSEGVRSTMYNPVNVPLCDLKIGDKLTPLLQTVEPRPQILDVLDDEEANIVNSRYGPVSFGCVLAYQQPPVVESDESVITLQDVGQPPDFILPDLPMFHIGDMSDSERVFYGGLCISRSESLEIEQATRSQAGCPEWHKLRKPRLTASLIKRVSSRKSDFEKLADQLAKPVKQTAAMRYGSDHEAEAATAYCTLRDVNTYSVGLVINPSAPHLGCSPDRRVYDPSESDPWGLLEIKCPQNAEYAGCQYLRRTSQGLYQLKKSHQYYVQVLTQMALTGCTWCDFFVRCKDDHHWERIYFVEQDFVDIKTRIDKFFFQFYLPVVMSVKQ